MDPRTFALEVRFAEFTARYLWGVLRPLLGRGLARRCDMCVLPETYTEIGSDGLCSECRMYMPEQGKADDSDPEGYALMRELLMPFQRAGKGQYDALLLFSGGKDSALLLHSVVEMCPDLRVLTVLVDNGFMSPFALKNAGKILERFDVDHVTIRPRYGFVRKVFRHALTHLDAQEGYSIVDLMDGYITFDSAKNLAASLRIPVILCGLSKTQAENAFGITGHKFPPEEERARVVSHAGIELRDVFDNDEMQYWWDGSRWPADCVPQFLLPFCVWDPGEAWILRRVDELGLIPASRRSPLLTNNALIPVIGLAEVARFGYSSFEVEFAKNVREGKSERRYWLHMFEMLEYSTRTGRFVNRTVEEVLAALGLTKKDIGIPGA